MTLRNSSPLDDIDLVVFDLIGTLVEIGSRRRPFAHLRRKMGPEKAGRFRLLAMTTGMNLSEIDAELQGGATADDLVVAQAVGGPLFEFRIEHRVNIPPYATDTRADLDKAGFSHTLDGDTALHCASGPDNMKSGTP